MGIDAGVVLVTGAGSGIGRQVALSLARRGRTVAGLDCLAEGLDGLEHELAREQRAFAWGVADVTEADGLRRAVEALAARLGPVELLIASAGVAGATPAEGMRATAAATSWRSPASRPSAACRGRWATAPARPASTP
jgi:NAD(P)-dependent dehydrogenase (short-subunit alcohol dehydrogenase family)